MVKIYWNHRALKKNEYGEEALYIVEVYYSDDGGIIGWTGTESVHGENIEGLHQCLEWMSEALEKPILDEEILLAQMEQLEAMGADDLEVRETGSPDASEVSRWESEGGNP